MPITRTKRGGFRATGRDANRLFIAFCSDEQLQEMFEKKTGSEDFQTMVKEAIEARKQQKGVA